MSSMQNSLARKTDSGNYADVTKEVQQLIADGHTNVDVRLLNQLRQKYPDSKIVDAVLGSLTERVAELKEKADRFAKAILKHIGEKPLHVMLERANKIREREHMSDSEFEFFRRSLMQKMHNRPDQARDALPTVNTNMGRALGQYESTFEGLNAEQGDMQYLQAILKQYALSKALHNSVVIQSMMYKDLEIAALKGEFDPQKHNAGCHVSPVLAAMFLPKIPLFEDTFLYANISYIVKCRYEKQQLLTKSDHMLLYNLIADPNDVVCDMDSPFKDLLHRVQLQETLWQSVNALRSGRYFDCISNGFASAVENCRLSNADAPDMIYSNDECSVIRRVLQAFSFRPMIVQSVPSFSLNNPMNFPVNVNRVSALPMITVRIPTMGDGETQLSDALSTPEYFVENNTIVPKMKTIIYSRGVLIYHVGRRTYTPKYTAIIEPNNWQSALPSAMGFEKINNRPITIEHYIDIGTNGVSEDSRHYLRSVVALNTNPAMPELIIGTCALLVNNGSYQMGQQAKYFMYNPQFAAFRPTSEDGLSTIPFPALAELHPQDDSNPIASFQYLASRNGTIYIYAVDKNDTPRV